MIGDVIYESGKARRHHAQAVAPAYRAHLLCVRVQHVGVYAIGLLTDIAASFSLTEAQAGIMISVYAWGVMLLSLPLMVFASRFEFKRMLLGVLAVFSLGQFLSAVAPTYPILVCARLVVACAHAVFWSVASIMRRAWLTHVTGHSPSA